MVDWLAHSARRHPDSLALVDADTGRRWTYLELSQRVQMVADWLGTRGIEAGDRVGVLGDRSPETIVSLWAVIRTGATVAMLDPDEPPATLQGLVEAADLDLVLSDDPGVVASIGHQLPVQTESVEAIESTDPSQASRDSATPDLDDTRFILFTSGTTGEPKGVRLTARNIGASAAGSAFRLGVEPDDRWLLTLPMYHMGGLSVPLRSAIYGRPVVVEREFDAAETYRTIDVYDVTGVSLVPTMLDRLLDGGPFPDSLRFALVGGARTPPELVERAIAAEVPLYTTYGMTETASQVATATPDELETYPETVGRPLGTVSVDIEEGAGKGNSADSTGEIVVSGPVVSPGYLDEAHEAPRDHFATGDLGFLDNAGRLFVTGRKSEQIVTGGENVDPVEVETALRDLEPVSEAVVVGIPDPEWGERVAAAVVLADTISTERLREALSDRLAAYKIPKTIRAVDSIPYTASGTVDRAAVRAEFEQG